MRRLSSFATAVAGLLVTTSALLAQTGSTDALIKSLQVKVKIYPGDYKSYAGLGAAYLQKGRETGDAADYELAKAALGKSLDLLSNDPAASFAMTQMAVACMAEHRFKDAYEWAQRALAVGSGDPSPWAIAGDALADVGDYANAAEAYEDDSAGKIDIYRMLCHDLPPVWWKGSLVPWQSRNTADPATLDEAARLGYRLALISCVPEDWEGLPASEAVLLRHGPNGWHPLAAWPYPAHAAERRWQEILSWGPLCRQS